MDRAGLYLQTGVACPIQGGRIGKRREMSGLVAQPDWECREGSRPVPGGLELPVCRVGVGGASSREASVSLWFLPTICKTA